MYNKVTISGLICTGKTTLFWGLQENLIWPTFSVSQFFRDYARIYNLSLEKAEEQNKILTKRVDLRVSEMLKNPSGNLIVEGWMAGIMADCFPHVLRVLLTSRDKVRIERFAKRGRISFETAEEKIKAREKNLFDALEKIYHRGDFVDPKNYNFTLDTTDLVKEELIEKVLRKLK